MTATETAVTKAVEVGASVERAFAVLTEQMGSWWPPEHHIADKPFEDAIVEPREGGRWYERAADGSECDWGRVLAWDPPHRVAVSWHLGGDFQYDPDPQRASVVEIRFEPTGEDSTRVVLEHRHLERHGPSADNLRAAVDAPDGWSMTLSRFAEAVAG